MVFLSVSSLIYSFFAYPVLLQDEKTKFVSQQEVLTKNRYVEVSVTKSTFLASLGIVHVDKVAFTGQLQVLSKNRYVKFLFAETNFFNAREASRSR